MKLLNFFRSKPVPLREDQTLVLTTSVAFVCAPHFLEIPYWCTALALLGIAYRYLSDIGRTWRGIYFPKANRWLLYAVTLLLTYLVFKHFGSLQGPEPSTALLVLLICLKLLESQTYRDAMIVLILSYFISMTWLLFSQTLPTTIYLFFAVLYSTASLMSLHSPPKLRGINLAPTAGMDLLKALPIFIVMFFLFPRFATPFGAMISQPGAQTGFSGDLNPGDISSLAQSNEVAFRVRFMGDKRPLYKELYWRGSVLSNYSGLSWVKSRKSYHNRGVEVEADETFEHEILVEPRFKKWLFGLDRPIDANFVSQDMRLPIRMSDDQEIQAPMHILQPTLIRVLSSPGVNVPPSESDIASNLELDDEPSERLVELAKKLKEGARTNLEIAERTMRFFRDSGFLYSLEPGPVASIDQFLFERKIGFCEHYSAAMATIMRAAGVPARVVVGFYGGTYNDYGQYLIVRDKDAHAWIEIYQKGLGWKRFDPTNVVSPDRMGRQLASNDPGLQSLNAGNLGMFEKIVMAFDYLNNEYTMFLISFDSSRQLQILAQMGFNFDSKVELIIVCIGLILIATIVIAFVSRGKKVKVDKVTENYSNLLLMLKRAGVPITESMGPLEVFDAVNGHPDFKKTEEFGRLMELYAQARYNSHNPNHFLKEAQSFLASGL